MFLWCVNLPVRSTGVDLLNGSCNIIRQKIEFYSASVIHSE